MTLWDLVKFNAWAVPLCFLWAYAQQALGLL